MPDAIVNRPMTDFGHFFPGVHNDTPYPLPPFQKRWFYDDRPHPPSPSPFNSPSPPCRGTGQALVFPSPIKGEGKERRYALFPVKIDRRNIAKEEIATPSLRECLAMTVKKSSSAPPLTRGTMSSLWFPSMNSG